MATNLFFPKTLYLLSKYMILIEIMLTSIKYFFMSGADILVLTWNWSKQLLETGLIMLYLEAACGPNDLGQQICLLHVI